MIPNGGSATCTVTNDDLPATLIVKKVVVNDNGGTKRSQDFSFSVNGGQAQSFEADGQNDLEVAAGTYDVTEPAVAGYTTTYQGCADIELPLGGTATCIVTNNDVPRGQGSIDVQKSANPTSLKEPGGPVTFSVTITNTSATSTSRSRTWSTTSSATSTTTAATAASTCRSTSRRVRR